MSSSRSLAGALQRRAGDSSQQQRGVQQRGAPTPSIKSQQVFAQQQQQYQQPMSQSQYQQHSPQMQQQQQQQQVGPQIDQFGSGMGKMTIPNAIALITIRLSKLETIIQKMQIDGVLDQDGTFLASMGMSESSGMMMNQDSSIIQSIVSRLETIEKMPKQQPVVQQPSHQITIQPQYQQQQQQQQQAISKLSEEITQLNSKYDAISMQLNDTKDLLLKLQNYTMETNEKLVNMVLFPPECNQEQFNYCDIPENKMMNDSSTSCCRMTDEYGLDNYEDQILKAQQHEQQFQNLSEYVGSQNISMLPQSEES